MQTFTNRTVVIPRNDNDDDTASLRLTTNIEKGTVTFGKYAWEGDKTSVVFPIQYVDDVLAALKDVQEFHVAQKE